MFAILETGGKQVKVEAGRFIDIEKIPQNKGEKVSLNNVLMLVSGKDSKIGSPFIKGAVVNGQVIDQAKDDKTIVYKMKPKKGTRKKQGHRQLYSRVFIESIELDGKVLIKAEAKQKKEIKVENEINTESTSKPKKATKAKKD